MSSLAAAWVNLAGSATLTAFSAATNMPVTLLQQEDTRRNWRTGATTTAYVLATYAANQSADTFYLANTNLTGAGIARVRLSSVDATGAAGDVWDSNAGGTAGQVDPTYKDLVVLASSVKSGWKYCRIDLTDTSRTYLEAGFLFIGTRTRFAYNYSYGAQFTWIDPSEHKKTKGGQTKIRMRPQFRRWELPFGFVTEAQRWSTVESIDFLNGIRTPVLFIGNPDSTNLGRDSIFGLVQESSPVQMVPYFDSAGGIISTKTYRVEQRL